ncbi:MAG: hypothetical protein AAFQ87_00995, partial [Bacteroidota bacterium]
HDYVWYFVTTGDWHGVTLDDTTNGDREILRGVRYENEGLIRWQVIQLQAMINMIESHPQRTKKKLQAVGLDSRNSRSGYENMIVHARSIIKMANNYLNSDSFDPNYRAYGKGYYYFNNQLLDVYNHHKYGMLAYYNRFLSFADVPMVKMIEEPPFFRVIYSLDREQSAMLTIAKEEQAPDTTSLALYAYRRTQKPKPQPAAMPRKQVPQETIVASVDNSIIAEPTTPTDPEIPDSLTDSVRTSPSITERLGRLEETSTRKIR